MVRQRAGPNVTVARLRHLLARADVTLARRHRRPRLQRIPDIIAAMEQYHVAKHYAAPSPIMRTWRTQQRAVRLKGDNRAYITRVLYEPGARSISPLNRSRPEAARGVKGRKGETFYASISPRRLLWGYVLSYFQTKRSYSYFTRQRQEKICETSAARHT